MSKGCVTFALCSFSCHRLSFSGTVPVTHFFTQLLSCFQIAAALVVFLISVSEPQRFNDATGAAGSTSVRQLITDSWFENKFSQEACVCTCVFEEMASACRGSCCAGQITLMSQ